MALHLFTIVEKVYAQAADMDHDAKVSALCKDLPTSYSIAYKSISRLNWAVYNFHLKDEPSITEDLSDNCYETNRCVVCDFAGKEVFYFSTSYGLEQAVCEQCVCDEHLEPKDDSSDYVVSESDLEEEETDETDYDEDEDEETHLTASLSLPTTPQSTESEADHSEEDEEFKDAIDSAKFFGCEGCPYEWRAGYKSGWLKAMKHMKKYITQEKDTEAPRCAYCDDSHEELKKCGRCGLVRYCSENCQAKDWREHKSMCRRA